MDIQLSLDVAQLVVILGAVIGCWSKIAKIETNQKWIMRNISAIWEILNK